MAGGRIARILYHKSASWRAFRPEIYDNRQDGDYGNNRQDRASGAEPRPSHGIQASREGEIRWARGSVKGSVAIPASAASALAFGSGLNGH